MRVQRMLFTRTARLRLCVLLLLTAAAIGAAGMLTARPRVVSITAEPALQDLSGLIIALDPGHGGYDGGTRGRDSGVWEKELTLQIAEKLEHELVSRGAKVVLTRREDVALCETGGATLKRKRADLQARVDIAKEAGATVFLSIHLNDYRSRRECGPQVFYQRGGDDGRLLAGVLQAALIEGLSPRRARVAMAGDYYVLKSAIPSALVECGFLSNAEEERLLRDADYQQRIAESIADGLCEYCALPTVREAQP